MSFLTSFFIFVLNFKSFTYKTETDTQRLTSKKIRCRSLLILLLSVAPTMRNLLKITQTEECSVHTNLESFFRKQYSTRILKNQFNSKQIIRIFIDFFFDEFVYSWYFILYFLNQYFASNFFHCCRWIFAHTWNIWRYRFHHKKSSKQE